MSSDGYATFVDRTKDCIRRRGENISAADIAGIIAGLYVKSRRLPSQRRRLPAGLRAAIHACERRTDLASGNSARAEAVNSRKRLATGSSDRSSQRDCLGHDPLL